jgi:hypothetical protein
MTVQAICSPLVSCLRGAACGSVTPHSGADADKMLADLYDRATSLKARRIMPPTGKLLAWIEPRSGDRFLASFISAAAVPGCPPATHLCSSRADASQWITDQAAAVGFQVEWVDQAARG